MDNLWMLFAAASVMVAVIGGLALLGDHYTLNNIKSKTVGDGQHGTARWATNAEIRKTYALVPFRVPDWRAGEKSSHGRRVSTVSSSIESLQGIIPTVSWQRSVALAGRCILHHAYKTYNLSLQSHNPQFTVG